jgi:hypothetical protein
MIFQHLAFGGSGHASKNTQSRTTDGTYGTNGTYEVAAVRTAVCERQTPNGTYLRRGGFHRKNPKMPDPTGTALANGALQYRNIRYWAADSCL